LRLLRRHRPGPSDRWVIVGLGNPGERYARHRHNVGVMVIDVLARRTAVTPKRHKSGCLVGETSIAGEQVAFARPTTYMNDSGQQVGALVRFYKVPPDRVVIVHDELDVPYGEVRIKRGGGTAGHNGLRSVASHLHTQDFVRVRVGISRPGRQDSADYVLSDFSSAQRKELDEVLATAADAVERIVEVGIDRAMNEFNTRDR
jgi:PTH1 family peptidyl-tRNA hydrolase